MKRWLPKTRRGRRAVLALIVANEVRGLIVAGPALVVIVKHWF